MSYRTSFRGGRTWGRGRRSYSDGSSSDGGDSPQQLVSGDSHFRQVRDANRGFRPPYNRGNSNSSNFESPPTFTPRPRPQQQQPFSYACRPPARPLDQNQQAYRPAQPRYGFNQQFRPRWQQQQQQFRPPPLRPPKELEYRNWEYAKPGPPPECERFTILSYNILADYLAKDHRHKLYFHIPAYMMDWQWRKRSIIFELGLWSADILCFQEVDRFDDLKEELGPRGYNGIWKRRTGDAVDGCAIFWRNSRFKLLQEESIEFNTLGLRDNVAQICVFESLNHCNHCKDTDVAAPTESLKQANKVVVCNIHVLFNPRRGEIKLGQIRLLLSQANAISKLWDDAPVIVCGDFNSTPKSPLYNFIAEQKLDLSELPRDQVSGQTSAEIYPSRPPNPDPGAQAAGNFSQVSLAACQMKTKNCDFPLAIEKQEQPDESSENEPFAGTLSKPFSSSVDESVECCTNREYANKIDVRLRENDLDTLNVINDENQSTVSVSYSDLKESTVVLPDETASSVSPVKDAIHDPSLLEEKIEILSLNEIHEDTVEGEENINLLSDVNYTGGVFPCQFSQSQRLNPEQDGSLDECASSHSEEAYSLGNEILDNTPVENSEIINTEQSKYDPSAWTPFEIEAATGSSDCVMMEHPLKLRSVYGEVEDCSGTRDSSGEPAVTSYHRRFFGTVDYIWRSDGLQTSRVLAPIPKHAMQWTRGFPSKKWGSDHIALVSELAFRKEISTPNAELQLQDHAQH